MLFMVEMRIGFRGDEIERIIRASEYDKAYYKRPYATRLYGHKKQLLDTVKWRSPSFPLRKHFHFEIIKYWQNEHPEFPYPKDSNCAGCHHKNAQLINQNYKQEPEILQWFANQEKKGKYNTWHDSMVPYQQIFEMNFSETIDFDTPGCNTGFCTD
jgi:hypothetical protein